MPDRTRLTAVKTQVGPLLTGAFHAAQGFDPAYVITKEGAKVSRARILATVMNKFVSDDGQYGFLVLDDETETMRVKFFKNTKPLEGIEIGDLVDVVGKLRQYEGELYLQPEIIRKVEDPNFLVLRMAELVRQKRTLADARKRVQELQKQSSDLEEVKKLAVASGLNPDLAEAVLQAGEAQEQPAEDKRALKERIVKEIERLDDGSGTDYGLLIKGLALPEARIEPIINELLTDGTCFEPRPGRIKKL